MAGLPTGNLEDLAKRIVLDLALAVIQGENMADYRRMMLNQYGEYGFELAEALINKAKAEPEYSLVDIPKT